MKKEDLNLIKAYRIKIKAYSFKISFRIITHLMGFLRDLSQQLWKEIWVNSRCNHPIIWLSLNATSILYSPWIIVQRDNRSNCTQVIITPIEEIAKIKTIAIIRDHLCLNTNHYQGWTDRIIYRMRLIKLRYRHLCWIKVKYIATKKIRNTRTLPHRNNHSTIIWTLKRNIQTLHLVLNKPLKRNKE